MPDPRRTRRPGAMNRRRRERAHLIYFLRVFDAARGDLLGQMVNLTTDGINLIGEKAIAPRRRYRLRMDLPRNVAVGRQLVLEATCKWCRRDGTDGFFSMGFRIMDMGPDAREVVKDLIEKFYREAGAEDPQADMNPEV